MLAQSQQAAYAAGDMWVVARCQGVRALALLELGRLDDARAEAQAAARATDDLDLEYFLGRALATLAGPRSVRETWPGPTPRPTA